MISTGQQPLQMHTLFPEAATIDAFFHAPLVDVFAEESLHFVTSLSRYLMAHCSKTHPDLYALGYWFRPAHLAELKSDFLRRQVGQLLRPKGTLFQVSPGNVDIQFMYSSLLALLTGNRIAVRISSRVSPQLLFLLSALNQLQESGELASVKRFLVFTSEHDAPVLHTLSRQCDLRLLWGSNETIDALRHLPLPARAKELSFPQRYSACVIDAQAILALNSLDKLVLDFKRDLFSFAQQACSSPKVLYWLGSENFVAQARKRFWHAFDQQKLPVYEQHEINLKILSMQHIAMMKTVQIEQQHGALIRMKLAQQDIDTDILSQHRGFGFLLETELASLKLLSAALPFDLQTLCYFGVAKERLCGSEFSTDLLDRVDRLVPVGRAVEFDAVWDGYDLLHEFTRHIL
jgi:hypothetical protein